MPITAKGSGGPERHERRLEAGFGERGQLALGGFQPRVAQEITRRDPEELASLEPAQAFASLLLVAPPFEGVEGVGRQLVTRDLDRQRVVVVERVDELGVTAERVADHPARPEQVARTFGGPGRRPGT